MACGVGLCSVIEGAVLPAFSRRDENRGRSHRWFPRRVSHHSFNSPRTGLQHDFDRWRRVAADIEAGIENAEAALPDIGDIEIRWHAGSHESSEVSARNGRYHKVASLIVDKRSSRGQPLIHTGFRKSAVHLQPDAQCGTGRNAVYGHSSVDPYAGRNVEREIGHILIENIDLGVSESEARTTVGVLLRHPCPHIVGTGRNAADVEFPNKCVPLWAQHGGYCGCSKIVRRICVARTNRKKCIDGGCLTGHVAPNLSLDAESRHFAYENINAGHRGLPTDEYRNSLRNIGGIWVERSWCGQTALGLRLCGSGRHGTTLSRRESRCDGDQILTAAQPEQTVFSLIVRAFRGRWLQDRKAVLVLNRVCLHRCVGLRLTRCIGDLSADGSSADHRHLNNSRTPRGDCRLVCL